MVDATDEHSTHDGTATDVTFGTGGIIGNKGLFNGTTSRIILDNGIGKNASGTISAWLKPAAWGNSGVVFQKTDAGGLNTYHGLFCSNDQLDIEVWLSSGSGWQAPVFSGTGIAWNSTNYPSNAWTHLVATWDGSQVRLYRNGGEASDSPIAQTISNGGTDNVFGIGRFGVSDAMYFNGSIDEVGIWSRALSGAEVTSLYNGGAGLAYPLDASGPANLTSYSGNLKSNITSVSGNLIANMKTLSGNS